MKYIKIILVIVLFPLNSWNQDTASVLFLGNSYTYVNNLPVLLENIATSLGDVVNQDSQTPGGYTFG